MNKKLIFMSVFVVCMLNISACGTDQPNVGDTVSIEYEYTEDGLIKPEIAEAVIKETSDKLIYAIKEKDADTISDFVHPNKGVRFTPYTYVSLEDDIVFNREEIKGFFEDQGEYIWGFYDGIG